MQNGSSRGVLVMKLFEEFYERVYWFARRSVDAPTAEDVAQEVFVRLLRIVDLEDRLVTSSYLVKVADNLIKRRHKQKLLQERFEHIERRSGDEPEWIDREVEPAQPVNDPALARLSKQEHAALRLIVCEGLSYEAVSKSLAANVSTVSNWKFRGLRKLKNEAQERLGSIAG
ncbi:MAG: sigma-70 family RNA polymerase sigma factor [Planctomycetota bacterium]